MLNEKKGQISIFIVIGIILIFVVIFLFYNSGGITSFWETPLEKKIKDTVEDCILREGESGAFLLGFQGGYIEIPRTVSVNPNKYIDLGLKIPNWDSEKGNVPTIESMQEELNAYVSEQALSCINANLRQLDEFARIEIAEEMEIETEINKENIIFSASLPIKVSDENSEDVQTYSKYSVKLEELRLGDLYDLAVEIYNLEENTHFAEELTLDQIYSASDYSSAISMPTEGMSFSCNSRVWTIPQLKKNLANLNNNNFKYLYFDGTYPIDEIIDANLNEQFGTLDDRAYYESHYVYSLDNKKTSFEDYKVDVMMPSTEVTGREGYLQSYPYREFEVTPSSGSIVKPMKMEVDLGAKIPIPCIQIYHHLYSLDYDLIVKLTDTNEDGQNYFFQFPLRVLIKNNNPKEELASPIVNVEETTATNEAFCSNESKQYPTIIYAIDKTNSVLLSDVNISYKCINLECDMGVTKKPTFNGVERIYADPYFEGDFPFCIGGNVIAQKEGYYTSKVRIDTSPDLLDRENAPYYDIEMIPVKEFVIDKNTFLIINREDGTGKRVYSEEDGSIYISVENKGYDFESEAMWPNEEGFLDKIELLDDDEATYNVSVIYADKDYNLKGILEINNWKPNIHSGNYLEVTITGTSSYIDEDSYIDFYNYMNSELVNPFSSVGIKIN